MYNASLKRKWDNKNVMDYAVKTAEQKGRKDLALELAREMLAENEPLDKIVRYTKLSIEEIQSL
jgi:hypothetical protein